MSITKPMMKDETGLKIVDALKLQAQDTTAKSIADALNAIAAVLSATGTYDFSTPAKLRQLVRSGLASKVLPSGSQITVPWTDVAAAKTYDYVFNVAHFKTATLQDGEVLPGMALHAAYAHPFGVQFSNYRAFYSADTAILPAGTYYITMGVSWGTKVVSGKSYYFTLTKDVPVGGQLSGFEGAPDKDPSTWQVKVWASNVATTTTEVVSVAEGNTGTSLGTLKPGGDGTLNCLQETAYGHNRWGTSAHRQFWNSAAGVGSWWKPQDKFDRFPAELLTKAGFLSGFTADFLDILTPVKVTTALNTVSDAGVGTTEDTYDKFFLPSLQEMFITPQLADVEGETWEYWKRASGRSSYAPWYTNMPNYITYALENKTSPQYVRLRSASRGYSYNPWYINPAGYVHNSYAINSWRGAPACIIV